MRLEASTINLESEADRQAVVDALTHARGSDDPLVALARSELTYIQGLWTDEGYVLAYQDGSADQYFTSRKFLTLEEIQAVFFQHLADDDAWKDKYDFEKKGSGVDPYDQAGRIAGRIIGRATVKGLKLARAFKKGFKEGNK